MWNILGIEPTKDIREIKRAYARLAKQYNPEEHPEEFKRIFDAYKSASALARSVNEHRSDPIVTITAAATEAKEQQEPLQHEQHEQSEQTEFNFTSVDIFPDFEITTQPVEEKFLQNMALKLSEKNKRDDISRCKWLLGKPTFLSVCDDKGFRKKGSEAA
ncbi:MAG: J domain-containing protein [Ruminococcus sp.]|nr:MAG: J domain-containing protein [Ruminococcus sp.]